MKMQNKTNMRHIFIYFSLEQRFSDSPPSIQFYLNPTAFRKAKIVYNFGLSECNRVKINPVNCTGIILSQ